MADGPLYIVIVKGTNQKYQLHFDIDTPSDSQFMDAKDKPISLKKLFNVYPVLHKIFHKFDKILKQQIDFIDIKTIKPEELKELLNSRDFNDSMFETVVELLKEAISIDRIDLLPSLVTYALYDDNDETIPKAAMNVVKAALLKLDDKEVAKIISNSGWLLKVRNFHVFNEKVIALAVYQNPNIVKYISNASKKLQMDIVKMYPSAIRNMTNFEPDIEVQKYVIQFNPQLFYKIPQPAKGLLAYAKKVEETWAPKPYGYITIGSEDKWVWGSGKTKEIAIKDAERRIKKNNDPDDKPGPLKTASASKDVFNLIPSGVQIKELSQKNGIYYRNYRHTRDINFAD